MKVLYILKKEPATKVSDIITAHKKANDVTVIDIRSNKNYAEIIEAVFDNDKVICY